MNEKLDDLVSVIIPFYSNSKWLGEALDSVYEQSVKPLEVIVINDGSKENIDNLQKKYSTTIFIEQKNSGAASARNRGILVAKGKYCAFLDSDDIWEKNKLEIQLTEVINSGSRWSATAYRSFGDGKEKLVCPYSKKSKCYNVIVSSCRIQTSTVMIESSVLVNDDMARFAENMKNGQDIYLWLYLANKYPLKAIDKPLTYFRLRGTNAHLNVNAHIRVRAQLWEKMTSKYLPMPEQFFTKMGYRKCYKLYSKYDCNQKTTKLMKIHFFEAWLCFRIGKHFADKK